MEIYFNIGSFHNVSPLLFSKTFFQNQLSESGLTEIRFKTETSITFKSRDIKELTPELVILMNISTCILLFSLKKLFFILKLVFSVIFFDTVETSLFHYKFKWNHLPEVGSSSSLTLLYPAATAESLMQHCVTKTSVFFPATNRFRNEHDVYA